MVVVSLAFCNQLFHLVKQANMMLLQVILGFLLFHLSTSQLNNKRFPSDFMFGCATSAFQIEGAWNEDGKSPSVWDTKNHQIPSVIADNSTADISSNSYHKYKEDVALLKAIGVTHYRFSISWARILPRGFSDYVNPLGIAYYKKLIAELRKNGIESIITIGHGDIPQVLGDLGGYYNASFPDWVADYARVAFDNFGDDVKYWVTINEPYETCIWDGADVAYECAANVLRGHAKIWHLYDEEYRAKQKGRVSIPLNMNWYEPESSSPLDVAAAETMLQFTWGFFAHPIYYGDWPEIMKSRIALRSKLEGYKKSRLPEFTPEEIEYIKGTVDFFSANTYSTSIVRAIPEPEIGQPDINKDIGVYAYQPDDWPGNGWLKSAPWGMRKLLNWFKKEYFNPEILISENGYYDTVVVLDDSDRQNYLSDYLSAIRDAMEYDDVKVIGYNVWSLMDNFEWNSGYTNKFGLAYVDMNDPNRTRTRRKSSYYYEKVCKTRCVVDNCVD